MTYAPSSYQMPTANDCPAHFDLRRYGAANPADSSHRSKAVDEPPLLLSFSVLPAIRDAVSAVATLPCRVLWLDQREAEFPADPSPPHVERLCVEPVQAAVRQAPPGAFYLVLTHRHDLDLAITEAILRRGDFGFLGLIGSTTKRARLLHRFEERGVPAAALARLSCPIGLPGIAGKEPEVIAVAVLAQLLALSAPAGSVTATA